MGLGKTKVVSKKIKKNKGVLKVNDKQKSEKQQVAIKTELEPKKRARLVYARAKNIRISARKVRLVVDCIRGQNALVSVARLHFERKGASLPVRKAVESAVANAVNNFEMDKKKLIVIKAFVDEAPTIKRGRAGSRGRYKTILKRGCNIIIGVGE